MTQPLRLFLLNTVLFPGMELPLHVFEERYKQLVSESLADDEPFGVLLIEDGREVGDPTARAVRVGCTARIENAAPIEGGRLMIATRGERRFRIQELHDDRPYQSATVEFPVDEIAAIPDSLLDRATNGLRQISKLRAMVEGTFQQPAAKPLPPGLLADRIATAAAGLVEAVELQPVLEAFDLRKRLEVAVDLLDQVVEAHHEQARDAVAQRYGSAERLN
jgi:hypothetical protein